VGLAGIIQWIQTGLPYRLCSCGGKKPGAPWVPLRLPDTWSPRTQTGRGDGVILPLATVRIGRSVGRLWRATAVLMVGYDWINIHPRESNFEHFQGCPYSLVYTSPVSFHRNKIIGCFLENQLCGYGWYQEAVILG
jgi:hypothetical protein